MNYSLSSEGQKSTSRCQYGRALWRLPGRVLPASSGFRWLTTSLVMWPHHSKLCLHLCLFFLSSSPLLFLLKTLVKLRADLDNLRQSHLQILHLIIPAKILFPDEVTSQVMRIRMGTYLFGGPPFNPLPCPLEADVHRLDNRWWVYFPGKLNIQADNDQTMCQDRTLTYNLQQSSPGNQLVISVTCPGGQPALSQTCGESDHCL